MSTHKEFHGKSLDDAIAEACNYYGTEREKLEIEIVNDAKTGIFGLVGIKKACIRARRTPVSSSIIADLEAPAKPSVEEKPKQKKQTKPKQETVKEQPIEKIVAPVVPAAAKVAESAPVVAATSTPIATTADKTVAERSEPIREKRPAPRAPKPAQSFVSAKDRAPRNLDDPMPTAAEAPTHSETPNVVSAPATSPNVTPAKPSTPPAQRRLRAEREKVQAPAHESNADNSDEQLREDAPELALNICSEEEVSAAVLEAITKLVTPIVGESTIDIAIHDGRIRVSIDCGEASGILVGREGQTLASVQYLVARLVAKRLGGAIRLQIDVGNYRERQDDRLKELAIYLADKAKKTRRTQATRPLSAYQRRIIHLVLEEDDQIQTHSKGEGPHRRVVIQLKRGANDKNRKDEELNLAETDFNDELTLEHTEA